MTDDQIKTILQNSKTIAMIGVNSLKKKEDPKMIKRKPATVPAPRGYHDWIWISDCDR